MSARDLSGLVGIVLIFGTGYAIAWYLVHVARVGWFRRRMLYGNRTERAVAMLPIMVPVYLFFMIVIRPLFP